MTALQKVIKYCAVAFAIFMVVSIIGGIIGAVSVISLGFGGSHVGEMQTYAVSDSLESLDIDLSAANLEIKTGSGFSLESNHKYLTVKEQDGVLTVSESRMFWGFSSGGGKVILTVPEGFVFEDASITAGAGKVTADVLSSNTLRLELGAGTTDINCLNATSGASIDGGAGKLTIGGGELRDLCLNMGVGALELTGKLTGDCSLDYGVGDTRLVLLGNKEDYQIKLDKGLGTASLDGKAMEDDSVYGGGRNRIDIDGGVGSLKIRFSD
ncbi:MAG: DUF4097 family beta strand repeat-containing protein [Faecousia sp.]